ncbi:hypothetical protein [Proteiniphilum sp. X52]|uniref:hypothetical protein n=1 Tax=Proteiniphilum sp. X52 TaxID=2382159 RepID=UPI000F0A04D2|nr:hypothetical protein [Proteiniphilum sp. X52]RNC66476.1 hypothetical protein D7D25_03070 [Proteiniphilum sp. X52]
MAIVYKNCIPDTGLPVYDCNPCAEGEKGRVSTVFIFKEMRDVFEMGQDGITPEGIINIDDLASKINNGDIVVIPNVRGTYDGGTPKTITGFGRQAEKVVGKTHVIVWNDKNHSKNGSFYSYLEDNPTGYFIGWTTENEFRVSGKKLDKVEVKDPVEEDVESLVLWQVTVTWTQSNPNIPKVFLMEDDIKELINNCVESVTP